MPFSGMVPQGHCTSLMQQRVQKILLVAALLMPGRQVLAAQLPCSGGIQSGAFQLITNSTLAKSYPSFPAFGVGGTGTTCSTTPFSGTFPIAVAPTTVPQDGEYGFFGFSLLSNQTTVLYLYSSNPATDTAAGCIAELSLPQYAAVCPFQTTLYAGTTYYVVVLTEGAEDTIYLYYDLLPQSFTPKMSTAPPATTAMPTTPPATTPPATSQPLTSAAIPLTTLLVQPSSTPAANTSVPPASTTALPLTTLAKTSSTPAIATSVPLATTTIPVTTPAVATSVPLATTTIPVTTTAVATSVPLATTTIPVTTTAVASVAVAISPSTLQFPFCKSPIKVVASVTGTNSAKPPSGSVTLSLNGINPLNATVATAPITGSVATFNLKSLDPVTAVAQALTGNAGSTTLLPGSYQLTAAYSGDTLYPPASGSASLEVSLTCPLITLTS